MPNIEITDLSVDLKIGAISFAHPNDSTYTVKGTIEIPFIDGNIGVKATFVNHSAPTPPYQIGPPPGMFYTASPDATRVMVPEADWH